MRWFLFYIALLAFSSCETEKIIFNGPYHVRFTEAALIEKESNSKSIKIEIHLAGPALSEDLLVFYAISGDAREGVDYTIIGTRGQVVIPSNEYFGYLEVRLLNNANNILRSQDVIFTITRVNVSDLNAGQSAGGIGKTFTLTIEDDCILSGTYTGNRGPTSTNTPGIKITSSDCENYRISDWDVAIFDSASPMPLNFIDNGDNTLTVPEQKSTIDYGFYSIDLTVRGIGTVNPNTRQIFLSLQFDDEDSNSYDVTITFNPE